MKSQSGIYLLPVLVLIANIAWAQPLPCDRNMIPKTDQDLLEQFWADFKTAINNKDRKGMSALIQFPFNCDYCIKDSSLENKKSYLHISKRLFRKAQYKIFLDPRLATYVNTKTSLLDILNFSSSDDGMACEINFSYISMPQSKSWEGKQHFFTLKKRSGRFLITSAWSVP